MGYDISIRRSQQVKTDKLGRKSRVFSGKVNLSVPSQKIEKFMFEKGIIKQTKAKSFKAIHRKGFLYLSDIEIIERYNAEIRGIFNYYHLTADFYKLNYFGYLMEYSCLATLAGKHNSSIHKIINKHKSGSSWSIKYKLSNGTSKEKQMVRKTEYYNKNKVICNDEFIKFRYSVNTNATIRARLQRGVCELCGKTENANFEVHHIPKVKDLSGNEIWEQLMKTKRTKTLVVCEDCHNAIHENN